MFGLIVSGRLVQTEFQQISETQVVTTIPDADNINHIVVFLTGAIPFPEGTAGQVYFSWPDPNAPPNWQPLGFISNQKPSAIFKISTLKKLDEMGDYSNMMFGMSHIVHNAQIGISIEPVANIQDVPSPNNVESYVTFAQRMLENFMNFVLSYTVNQSNMVPDPSATYVPLSTVQNWYVNFERRLQQNPNFWK
ncbi:protein OPI10 homolog [Diorhabda carinulata]|uniref:protein OPI10 homolog n=1 Tax=Diorhabda sublineata TaxID=1163346 RepID=UPI0024E0DB97|nr:protein OPI10 homolog [Diorhabda sublineata]XP_057666926.1 protein OPI10 homolog [Diorhabda carinulata]